MLLRESSWMPAEEWKLFVGDWSQFGANHSPKMADWLWVRKESRGKPNGEWWYLYGTHACLVHHKFAACVPLPILCRIRRKFSVLYTQLKNHKSIAYLPKMTDEAWKMALNSGLELAEIGRQFWPHWPIANIQQIGSTRTQLSNAHSTTTLVIGSSPKFPAFSKFGLFLFELFLGHRSSTNLPFGPRQ